jgi:GDP-mannose 6-dehydrogenase
MKISVFGLGYVGSVLVAYFADKGHNVLGVDINPIKIGLINKGLPPVIEQGLKPLIARAVKSGKLKATLDAKAAVLTSKISFICVGTPSLANGHLNLVYVKKVMREIGTALRRKKAYHTIILRSTVLPYSTERILIPILEKYSGKKCGKGFGIVFNPEFLREGTGLYDFHNPAYTVIGTSGNNDYRTAAKLYKDIKAPLIKTSIKTAEIIKYTNNIFHALKVTFTNEISNICRALHIDPFEVMDLFCLDKKLNLSRCYLKPGFAFGGSCLPKDVRAFTCHAKALDINVPILNAILPSNEQQIKYAVERITTLKKKKIGVLGIAFKAGTDDLRQSPIIDLIKILLDKSYSIKIYDRNVTLATLYGANKNFIKKNIPHINKLMVKNIREILDTCELIIIGNADEKFASIFPSLTKKQYVIDLIGIAKKVKTKAHYESIN